MPNTWVPLPNHQSRRARAEMLLLALLVLCCGCPLPSANNANSNNNGATASNQIQTIDPGTNTSIGAAAPLDLGATDEIRFQSTIHSGSDIDVFQLGTLNPGDHVVADVRRQSGNLDAVAAVFDAASELIDINDDRKADGSDLDPLVDFVIRGAAGTYYLAVIDYPGSNSVGTYIADVRIERGVGVPAPENQVLFLDWGGGSNIVIPNVGAFNLPPFSASDVGLSASSSQALKDRVGQIVKSRYSGFNITVLSSDHDPEPTTAHSTVYFGGRDSQAFAVSQAIDSYNQDHTDASIVFTGSYLAAFSHQPSFDEMANALGNTVAHEVGHLLGLVHTTDGSDLMDTSASNDRILQTQQFKTAALDDSVFPFGWQPARDLLTWTLGLVGM
jgi:hypothetical protein